MSIFILPLRAAAHGLVGFQVARPGRVVVARAVRFAVWLCFWRVLGVPLKAVIAGHPGAWRPGAGWFAGYAPFCRCRGRAGFVIAGHQGRISPILTLSD